MSIQRRKKQSAARLDHHRPAPGQLGLSLVVVCLIVTATHWPVLSAQAFSFDDPQYVFKNPLVKNPSWNSTARFFTEVLKPSTVAGYYQPLTMTSLMLDYALGGRQSDLHQFHRTNLSLHIANTALIIVLLYLLFGHVWAAAAVGLLFGVHPMTVEPVAWVVERKTLLATFFALGCLIAYARYARRPRWPLYGLILVLYVLALLSKPTTTPLPLLLLLLDYWPLRRLGRRALLEKIPLLIITAGSALITITSQHSAAGLNAPTQNNLLRIFYTLCHNIIFYLHKIVWPVDVSAQYPRPEPLDMSHPAVLAGVVGTVALITVLLIAWRWTRAPLVSWLFFFVAIFPTMGVIGFTFVIAADKYAYLPMLGLLILLTALLAWIWRIPAGARMRRVTRVYPITSVAPVSVAPVSVAPVFNRWKTQVINLCHSLGIGSNVLVLGIIMVLAGLEIRGTRQHLFHWQETERLHRYLLKVTPGAYSARYNLAQYLAESGRTTDAIREYELLKRQHPEPWKVCNSLGRVLKEAGHYDEAIAQFNESLRLKPDGFEAHYDLGVTLFESRQIEVAITHYRQAAQLRPDDYRVHVNLGNAFQAQGQFEQALACYDETLRLKPRYARGHYNRGLALTALGRVDEAITEFRRALEINPNYSSAQQVLEATLEKHNMGREP